MEDLIARIREALDETERIAREVEGADWYFDHLDAEKRAFDEHINSEWVLGQVAAHRKILELHERYPNFYRPTQSACGVCDQDRHESGYNDEQGCATVLAIAEAYGITVEVTA